MKPAALRILAISVLFLTGCRLAHNAAVSSYHVATAPVRIVKRQIDGPPPPVKSDVTNPGQPVERRVAVSSRPPEVKRRAPAASPSPSGRKVVAKTSASPSSAASPRGQSAPPQFPIAKPVPDKPGYVYSPSDPGKYVDVSGYAHGSKVKDPYSGKIFLVP